MSNTRWTLNDVAIVIVALPVLGVLMGGVYSVPAMYVTKSRDPVLTLLLAAGLCTTVFGLGVVFGLPWIVVLGAWFVAVAILGARRWFGPLDSNLERFGMVHGLVLLGMMWVILLGRFLA